MVNLHKSLYLFILTISLIAVGPYLSQAQYEYLATLNYNNLSLNQVRNIPGVTYVTTVNTTYDQNHQRFFFQGGPSPTGPFNLYTINAVSGATIYNTVCPSNNTGGSISGLQYDNATDTLYAMYYNGNGGWFFSWIDPSTGTVNIINSLPGNLGYGESTFDTKDHLYIYIANTGVNLVVVNASSGNVLYNSPESKLSQILYDNVTGKLYGINPLPSIYLPSLDYLQFDSVSMSTGTIYHISNLPSMSLPQIYTYAIDENAGKYIFLGEYSNISGCGVWDTLYALNVNTGAIVSREPYPYAIDPANGNYENVIEYSFDNKRGTLYAMNWNPPGISATPLFSITASSNSDSACTMITFTATPVAGVVNPFYQWQINGNDAGTNSPTYSSDNLLTGDTVRCILVNTTPCATTPIYMSNSIPLQFNLSVKASVSIVASAAVACANQQVSFTAHSINSGPSSAYQWILNGNNAGTNDSVYTSSSLLNGDSISCIITPNSNCVLPGPDSSNVIVVQVNPVNPVNSSVTIASSASTICNGDTVLFTASAVNGGTSPAYQWQINNTNTGTNNDTLITSSLMNGDVISCIMSSSITCVMPVYSADSITMTVNPAPLISFNPDTIFIKPGANIMLNPIVSGAIAIYLWAPVTALDNPDEISPVANPASTTTYQLTMTGNDGCQATGKETIVVYISLEMPSAFTPNGDGKDDVFRIPPSTPQKIQSFCVFNRWGEMIFRTANSSEGWDGTFRNQPEPTGTYIWMIEYEDILTGKTVIGKGTVILIR